MKNFENKWNYLLSFCNKNVSILMAVVLIVLFNFFLVVHDYISPENSSNPGDKTVSVLKDKGQIIHFSSSRVYSIILKFNANSNAVHGEKTTVKLLANKKTIYQTAFANNSTLSQNGPDGVGTQFVLNGNKGLKINKNKSYRLLLTSNASKGNEMSVYTKGNKIWVIPTYDWISRRSLRNVLIISEILLTVFVYSLFKFKRSKEFFKKIENQFLLTSFLLILLYSFVIPALRAPDEFTHFIRIYGILHGKFLIPKSGNLLVPANLIPVANPVYTSIYEIFKNFSTVLSDKMVSVNAINMALYSPQSYVLQLIGAGITSLFTKNTFIIIYGGRIITGLGCTIILYLAIKYIPFGKRILAISSLVPMNLAERASLSADSFTFSLVIALFAFALFMRYSHAKMTNSKLVLMYLILFFLASCKVIYFVLGFIVFIIPNSKFSSLFKAKCHKILLSFVLFGTSLGWLKIASRYLNNTQGGGNSNEKIHFIISQPFSYLKIVNQTFWTSNYPGQMLTGPLGALNIPINYILLLFTVFILFKTFYTEKFSIEADGYDLSVRCFTLLLCLANIFLVFTSLFVQWTNASVLSANITIQGIQGRYFLPILPMLMIMWLIPKNNFKIKSISNDNLIFNIFWINILVLSNAFMSCSL